MATCRNVRPVNSSTITHPKRGNKATYFLSSSSTSESNDTHSHSSVMPKHPNATAAKYDALPIENEPSPLTTTTTTTTMSADSNPSATESTKRVNNTNGKFSIQKILRQGFSSWRTKKKQPSVSTPPPPPLSIDLSSPPSPPLSKGRFVTNSDDRSQTPPASALRSISVDSVADATSPQRVLGTNSTGVSQTNWSSVDNVTVDFDQPERKHRGYIQSPWVSASTPSTVNNNNNATTADSIVRPTPVLINRLTSTETKRAPVSPPTAEVTYSRDSPTKLSTRVPPPGKTQLSHLSTLFLILSSF